MHYLGRVIENGQLNFSSPEPLHNHQGKPFPYVFLADDAFGLKPNLMKPYPDLYLPIDEIIFNYRLSRAHRTIEMLLVLQQPGFEYSADLLLQQRRRLSS